MKNYENLTEFKKNNFAEIIEMLSVALEESLLPCDRYINAELDGIDRRLIHLHSEEDQEIYCGLEGISRGLCGLSKNIRQSIAWFKEVISKVEKQISIDIEASGAAFTKQEIHDFKKPSSVDLFEQSMEKIALGCKKFI